MTPKQMLERALAGPQRPTPQPVTDEFAKAIAQKLETRGIVKVPGLPHPEPEPTWIDAAVEFERRNKELEQRWTQEREAAQAVPLNGAQVLRAALAGEHGTINGDQRRHSASALLEAEIMRGRSE